MSAGKRVLCCGGAIGAAGALVYSLVVRGALAPDLNVGRRTRSLGPITRTINAPPELVFDVIAGPYLSRTPRALGSELKVLERGSDMILAEHYTKASFGLVATTTETVRFERPARIVFRLVRGPVPSVEEAFDLTAEGDTTRFQYSGELATDLWALGGWWGGRVSSAWEQAVEKSVVKIAAEAERLSAVGLAQPKKARTGDS